MLKESKKSWKPAKDFVQILHVGRSGWLTLSTKNCPHGTVQICDSMRWSVTTDTNVQIATIPKSNDEEVTLEKLDVDCQRNGNDCGVHAIANALELCSENDPTTVMWQQEKMRSHLICCLEAGAMWLFPKKENPGGYFKKLDLLALWGSHARARRQDGPMQEMWHVPLSEVCQHSKQDICKKKKKKRNKRCLVLSKVYTNTPRHFYYVISIYVHVALEELLKTTLNIQALMWHPP